MAAFEVGHWFYVRKNDGALKYVGKYDGLVPHVILVGGVPVGDFVHKFIQCHSIDANGVLEPIQGAGAIKMIQHGLEGEYAIVDQGENIPNAIQVGGRRRRSTRRRRAHRRRRGSRWRRH